MDSKSKERARQLRANQTRAESILWKVLRAKRLSGLKFRRQYSVPPFIADFACVAEHLIVEVDGGYHDYQLADDLHRQQLLEKRGWTVLRFSNEDVLTDVDAVARVIVSKVGLTAEFGKRKAARSGMLVKKPPSPGL